MDGFVKHDKSSQRGHSGGAVVVGVLLLLVTNPIGGRGAGAADEPPGLDAIRAAVESCAQGIKTLEGKFIRKMSRLPDRIKTGPGPWFEDLRVEASFLADLSQRKIFLDEHKSYWLLGKKGEHVAFEIHEVSAFDGINQYRLSYSRVKGPVETDLPSDIPLELVVGGDSLIDREYLPWDFAGLRLFGEGCLGLLEKLRDPAIRVGDKDHPNGLRYVYLDHGNTSPFRSPPFGTFLDPAHDYLPARIAIMAPPPEEGQKLAHGFEVFEFKKFPDVEAGLERWFPVRGQIKSWLPEIHDIEVTELRVNQPIDAERFSIREDDLPEGVRVVNGRGGDESYTGGKKDLSIERQRLLDAEDARISMLLAPQTSGSEPRPPTNSPGPTPAAQFLSAMDWWSWLAVGIALTLLAAGIASALTFRRKGA